MKSFWDRELLNLTIMHEQQKLILKQSFSLDVVIILLVLLVSGPCCISTMIKAADTNDTVMVVIFGLLCAVNLWNLIQTVIRIMKTKTKMKDEDVRYSQLLEYIKCCMDEETEL